MINSNLDPFIAALNELSRQYSIGIVGAIYALEPADLKREYIIDRDGKLTLVFK